MRHKRNATEFNSTEIRNKRPISQEYSIGIIKDQSLIESTEDIIKTLENE